MILRRWEVRVRDLGTSEDLYEDPVGRFFTHSRASAEAYHFNYVCMVHGYKATTYYVHDSREDHDFTMAHSSGKED